MKCPYCGDAMANGYIKCSRQVLTWTPDNERKSFWAAGVRTPEVQLGDYSFLSGSRAEASYCPKCRKVIINV